MKNKSIRQKVTIGNDNYDVIYKSRITGILGTVDELRKGSRLRDQLLESLRLRKKFINPDEHIAENDLEPVALRRRHTKAKAKTLKLIVDPDGNQKERCPRCFFLNVIEETNGRERWTLGPNYPVISSKVDYGVSGGIKRMFRTHETSKYCDCCDTVYVAGKMEVPRY